MEENKTPAPEQAPVPAGKRSALLRYMVILFAVAFILVVLSLIFQISSTNTVISDLSTSNTGALARAEELQNTNRELQEQLDSANAELQTLREGQEAAQKALDDAENQRDAYDALLTVLTTEPVEGDIAYAKAEQTAENLRSYLSPEAQAMLDAHMQETTTE